MSYQQNNMWYVPTCFYPSQNKIQHSVAQHISPVTYNTYPTSSNFSTIHNKSQVYAVRQTPLI